MELANSLIGRRATPFLVESHATGGLGFPLIRCQCDGVQKSENRGKDIGVLAATGL